MCFTSVQELHENKDEEEWKGATEVQSAQLKNLNILMSAQCDSTGPCTSPDVELMDQQTE